MENLCIINHLLVFTFVVIYKGCKFFFYDLKMREESKGHEVKVNVCQGYTAVFFLGLSLFLTLKKHEIWIMIFAYDSVPLGIQSIMQNIINVYSSDCSAMMPRCLSEKMKSSLSKFLKWYKRFEIWESFEWIMEGSYYTGVLYIFCLLFNDISNMFIAYFLWKSFKMWYLEY